jgi:hypothetical protein
MKFKVMDKVDGVWVVQAEFTRSLLAPQVTLTAKDGRKRTVYVSDAPEWVRRIYRRKVECVCAKSA